MGQVTEPEGGASQVFEAAVDGFGGAVAGGGPGEEREDVVAACGQGLAESYDLDQAGGNARPIDAISRVMIFVPSVRLLAR